MKIVKCKNESESFLSIRAIFKGQYCLKKSKPYAEVYLVDNNANKNITTFDEN